MAPDHGLFYLVKVLSLELDVADVLSGNVAIMPSHELCNVFVFPRVRTFKFSFAWTPSSIYDDGNSSLVEANIVAFVDRIKRLVPRVTNADTIHSLVGIRIYTNKDNDVQCLQLAQLSSQTPQSLDIDVRAGIDLNGLIRNNSGEYVVYSSFIKRISRLALSATPAGAVTAIPMVYSLLKAHPSCMVLIHRTPDYAGNDESVTAESDPYLPDEADPAKCNALSSSLWELETLQHHYYPNIATLANVFNEPFHKPKFVLEDFLDHTYTSFFESDTARKPKKAPALAVQPPTSFLRPGDAISDFLVL
ncbi:Maturation and nuclear export of 40S ribosomal subunits interacting protein [Coemansia thaxteri]|uniref:Maturation and nuclear export of 40S ribosomal subunits interacting protein n=1 Tax=Coemansia thaxteri TaxID=2663907 RepID=A0A9W8BLE8_9FUNG|nr:Maturation and nuclear export of 40S ribosomal subunits interacting protein [Coemansia thaxteri]